MNPVSREKHFLVTEIEFDEDGTVIRCLLEAVISRRSEQIDWQELKAQSNWLQGWK